MEGIKTLALNTNLLRNEEMLVESLTVATTAFAGEVIKVVAKENALAAADSSSTVTPIVVPLDAIAAGATNAVAGCDKQLLAKENMVRVLNGVAGALVTAVAGNSDDAAHITTEMTKIAASMGESADAIYTNRDDFETPAGAMTPAMDGILDSLSKIATTKLTKAEVTAMYSSVAGAMAEKVGKSSNVDATNIDSAMMEIAKTAAAKTAYLAANRADISPADLKDVGEQASAAIAKSCMDIDDTSKVSGVEEMLKLIDSTSKGNAAGAGENDQLASDGNLIADFIAAGSKGSSSGISDGTTTSKHPMFQDAQDATKATADDATHVDSEAEASAKDTMAWMLQQFASAVSGGTIKGSLAIDTPNYNHASLERTYAGVIKSQVGGVADLAAKFDFFHGANIANSTEGMASAAAGALGSGTFKGNTLDMASITNLLTKGAEGAMDGLAAIDRTKVTDYTEETFVRVLFVDHTHARARTRAPCPNVRVLTNDCLPCPYRPHLSLPRAVTWRGLGASLVETFAVSTC